MAGRNYNLRASPGRPRVATTTSTSATSISSTTSVSSSTYSDERTLTPAPVQRTLYMEEADDEDDEEEEEEEEEEVVEQLDRQDDDVEEVQEMGAFGRGGRVEEGDDDEEEDDEETEDDNESDSGARHIRQRKTQSARRESAFGSLRRRAANSDIVAKLGRYRHVQQATSAILELWQFVVRNSFMTINFMWLLVPLGCFLIAILVPHYLTTAIRYVDILTSSSNGYQANLAYEKGMMRSIVQEIVDVKLLTMQDEITSLRNTIVSQEREVEALRLLHESLRQVHDDTQKKLSVVDSNSILSIHIEHVVSKHAETLWKRFQEKSTKIEESIRITANQQSEFVEKLDQQQDELRELRSVGVSSSTNKASVNNRATERVLKEELNKWKVALQEELHVTLQREVVDIDDRMHKSLLTEKQVLVDSVKSLSNLDAANPALVTMIESAVVKVEKKKAAGAPDYAALANGAVVVRSQSCLLDQAGFAPMQVLGDLFGVSAVDPRFTSPSFRSSPLLKLSSLLIPQDVPWWISRHNGRPETALSETKEIGSCWGLAGRSGRLTVKFPRRIFADSVTIDHIPEEIATDFSTAPQDFRVFGVAVDRSREVVEFLPFGNFSYERNGTASQTFRLASSLSQRIAIDAATLEIVSNHGHPDYTCLYRFQVHGTPAP